jgi:hypothetical protein
MYTPSKPE